MNDLINVEPAPEQRQAFARWCLSQTPRIETSSSTGSHVPLELYPMIPPELLEGAFVDGYPYGVASPQPVAETTPEAPVEAPQQSSDPEPPKPVRKPRKRASRTPRTPGSKLVAEGGGK